MANTPEELEKESKRYWLVGIILCGFTAVTLILGINLYHNFGQVFDLGEPGIGPPDVILALSIATVKSSLVCLIFMHLNHERGVIYKFLLFTVCFLISLMGLTLFARLDPIKTAIEIIVPQYG